MSTVKTWRISSQSSAETENLAEKIGANLRGGEVIELTSDVGGGKTTFTRGLARGAGSVDRVASPTFTVSKEYDTPKFTIVHYDFYRLEDPGIMSIELAEAMSEPTNVVVIEWSDIVQGVLPEKRLRVEFCRVAEGAETANGDEPREVIVTTPAEMAYVLEGVAV